MKYKDELKHTMTWLGQQNCQFVGQAVGCYGTFMSQTLDDIPIEQRLEFPVVESFQMQFSLGRAIAGEKIVSIFPRLNFLMLAVGDLVNMVDKFNELTKNKVRPKLIIRSAIGPDSPVHPGHQHVGDFYWGLLELLDNVKMTFLEEPEHIFPAYERAITDDNIHLIIEHGNYYQTK